MVRVPFAENVISRPAGGMALIVGSWIQSQLVEQIQIKRRLGQNARIGRSKNLNHALNKRSIAPPGRTGPANIERNGPHSFMRIRLTFRPIFQDRDRPIADVVVEMIESAGDDSLGLIPGRSLTQHGFGHSSQEKRLEQIVVAQMSQQILMMMSIGRKQMIEGQCQNCFGLVNILKSSAFFAKRLQPLAQRLMEFFPRWFLPSLAGGVHPLSQYSLPTIHLSFKPTTSLPSPT